MNILLLREPRGSSRVNGQTYRQTDSGHDEANSRFFAILRTRLLTDRNIFVKKVGYRAQYPFMTYCTLHHGFGARFSCTFCVCGERAIIYQF